MIRFIRLGTPTNRPPLYAVPGLDGSIGTVEPVVKLLAPRREVIVVDFSAETNPTLEALAAEIAGQIRAEGRPALDILGQSIGTIIATQVATRHSLPVRKVVLTCTFTVCRGQLLRLVVLLSKITPAWLYRATAPLTIAVSCGPVGDGRQHPAFEAARRADQTAAARRTAWQIDRDFAVDLARIQSPLLILMGDHDRFVPNAPREIAKLRQLFAPQPTAHIEVVPDAGHIFLPSAAIRLASTRIDEFLA